MFKRESWTLAAKVRAAGLVMAIFGLSIGCSDPPGDGSLAIFVDRTALRPYLSAASINIARVDLYYGTPGGPLRGDDTVCNSASAVTVSTQATAVGIPLDSLGSTFLGSFEAPPGNVAEVRFLLSSASATFDGGPARLHTRASCEDLLADGGVATVDADGDEHHGEDDEHDGDGRCEGSHGDDGDHGDKDGQCEEHPRHAQVLRILSVDGGTFTITSNQLTSIAAELNELTQIHRRCEEGDEEEDGDGSDRDGMHAWGPWQGFWDRAERERECHEGDHEGDREGGDEGDGEHGEGDSDSDIPRFRMTSSLLAFVIPPTDIGIIPDQVVVRFKDGTSQTEIFAAINAKSLTVLRSWGPTNYFTLQVPPGADLKDILEYYAGRSDVQYVMPNTWVEPSGTFDPFFPQQVQWPQVSLNELDSGAPDPDSGWGLTTGTFRPVVAVIDVGVFGSHPNLIANMFINVNEIPQSILNLVGDRNDSGTVDWRDLDFDNDGFVTFSDLDALNALFDGGVCPAANNPPANRCDPGDLVNGTGTQTAPPAGCTPDAGGGTITYGWEDGVDNDCNGFVDDIVGWNFSTGGNLPGPFGGSNHGTVVSGIIGAAGGTGIGEAGVNWQVRILPIVPNWTLTFDNHTRGYRDTVYSAFQYAALMHADAINASIGAYVFRDGVDPHDPAGDDQCNSHAGVYGLSSDKYDKFVEQLRGELADLNHSLTSQVVVIAAGNCGKNNDDPGIFSWPSDMQGPNVLAVASVGSSTGSNVDQLSWFSDFGQSTVQLAAPGEFFVELELDGGLSNVCPGSIFPGEPNIGCAGTSFATPMVTGTAALLMSQDNSLFGSPCRVTDRIVRNADVDAGNLLGKVGSGGPRLNVERALKNVVSTGVCP